MFLIDWFFALLSFLGIYERITGNLLLLGLDNAGKTTLLYKLKRGVLSVHEPTRTMNQEEIKVGSCTFKAIDIGGQESLRGLWKNYFVDVQGIMFMVDASHPKRFEEAKQTLNNLFMEPELKGIPFAVLGNKIDLRHKAVSKEYFTNFFGLLGDRVGDSPVKVFMCSVSEFIGIEEAFEWMGEQITKSKK